MKTASVLDSFALVCAHKNETGAEKVTKLLHDLERRSDKALLNVINWGEFYYIVRRDRGDKVAQQSLQLLEQLPIELVAADRHAVWQAAKIKAEYPLSYADAFVVATALIFNARILTGDPDFKAVEHLVSVDWL